MYHSEEDVDRLFEISVIIMPIQLFFVNFSDVTALKMTILD